MRARVSVQPGLLWLWCSVMCRAAAGQQAYGASSWHAVLKTRVSVQAWGGLAWRARRHLAAPCYQHKRTASVALSKGKPQLILRTWHVHTHHPPDMRSAPPHGCMHAGWEKPWVEQIVDRIMKNMLRTTEDRAQAVVSS